MKKTIYFALMSAVLGTLTASAAVDCQKLSVSVKQAVAVDQSKVLEIVSAQVGAAPGCACEIVKAAIEGSSADVKTVAAIVEAASVAAPEQMRLISQCAVAVAPDAMVQVQAVLAKLDPNLGESTHSATGAKGAKAPAGEVAALPNPLDFPGQGPVGPNPESPGGLIIFPGGTNPSPLFPPLVIPPVDPPEVTDPNPPGPPILLDLTAG